MSGRKMEPEQFPPDSDGLPNWSYTSDEGMRILRCLGLRNDSRGEEIVLAIQNSVRVEQIWPEIHWKHGETYRYFVKLKKTIDTLLEMLDEDPTGAMKRALEFETRKNLETISMAIKPPTGFRPKAGSPINLVVQRHYHVVECLIDYWDNHVGTPAGYTGLEYENQNKHPFHKFVLCCTEPTGMEITFSQIRKAVSDRRKHHDVP